MFIYKLLEQIICLFAVYMDARYETKGIFAPNMLDNSRSYREFIGYVIVAENSTMKLTYNETLSHFIDIVVSSSFVIFFPTFATKFCIQQFQCEIVDKVSRRKMQSRRKLSNVMIRNVKMMMMMFDSHFLSRDAYA